MLTVLFVLITSANIFARNLPQTVGDGEVIDLSHFGSRLFGSPVETLGRSLEQLKGNFEEQGPYLEGDLLVPTKAKNGMTATALRWKNGEVPFEIRGAFSKL